MFGCNENLLWCVRIEMEVIYLFEQFYNVLDFIEKSEESCQGALH